MAANAKRTTKKGFDYDSARTLALMLYVKFGHTQQHIAETVGVSAKTISQWADKDDWQSQRELSQITPAQLQMQLIQKANKLLEEDLTDAQRKEIVQSADALSKLGKTIAQLDDPVVRYMHDLDAGNRFLSWLLNLDYELAQSVVQMHQQYITERKKSLN